MPWFQVKLSKTAIDYICPVEEPLQLDLGSDTRLQARLHHIQLLVQNDLMHVS